ncbi:MAG: prepilin-type N-terminal cleavage/methylation domain-containing protein, partial [Myxococcota bacterium]
MTRRHGFTLIELLIATALLTIVAVYLLQTLTVNHRAYVVIDQVSESQQTMRAIATLIERDIRHAGMLVPQNAAVCGVDNANAPDILYVTDADAIDPQ